MCIICINNSINNINSIIRLYYCYGIRESFIALTDLGLREELFAQTQTSHSGSCQFHIDVQTNCGYGLDLIRRNVVVQFSQVANHCFSNSRTAAHEKRILSSSIAPTSLNGILPSSAGLYTRVGTFRRMHGVVPTARRMEQPIL